MHIGLEYTERPIRDTPPTLPELKRMLKYVSGDVRKLFNTSGADYKLQNLKDRLPSMSDDEALNLLALNGNLVKRPFALGNGTGAVGFKEEEWREKFL